MPAQAELEFRKGELFFLGKLMYVSYLRYYSMKSPRLVEGYNLSLNMALPDVW